MPDPDGANHEAFDLLGHEIRLAIIERLAEERRSSWRATGLEFAELRKAVGVADAGQFNYHLNELRGTFVEQRDAEYVVTTAGMDVAGTVKAGTYDADDVSFSVAIDATCTECDDPLQATYERGTLRVQCEAHGLFHGTAIPPAAVRDRDPERVVALAERNAKNELDRALAGACIHCWGDVDVRTPATVPDDALADQDATDDAPEQVLVEFACADCGMQFWTPASTTVVRHPAVVSFYHDHGVNVQEEGYLDLAFVSGTNGTVESRDPVRVRVDVELGNDALHVRIDDTATVVDTERT